jgi:hypothetical protein
MKTDGRSFAVTAGKDGKIRVRCGAWHDTKVIERHQELVFQWEHGQSRSGGISADADLPRHEPGRGD